jgi:hypothetical protein
MVSRFILLILISAFSNFAFSAGEIVLSKDKSDQKKVLSTIVIKASKAKVLALLQDIAKWKQVFSDIRMLEVLAHENGRWRVKMATQAFDCGVHKDHEYLIQSEINRVSMKLDASGLRAVQEFVISGDEKETQIKYSLFVDITGIYGLLVTNSSLEKKRMEIAKIYLSDLQKAF